MKSIASRSGILFASSLYGLLLAGVYYTTLVGLVTVDWAREDYSSSCFIPLIVGYLIWEKRRTLAATESAPTWKGIGIIVAGLVLYLLGELAGEFYTLYLSFWLVLVGLVWIHIGTTKLKEIIFPLAFLIAMFPLPYYINTMVTMKLKLLSSRLGVEMMQFCGISAYREGNVIDLGFTRLQVVDACSGLRYFIPLVILSLLLAYYLKGPFWKKCMLVISAIPISVVTNGLRIASVGILYKFWGPTVAEGFFHDFSGWFIFMFSLVILLFEIWVLKKIGTKDQGPKTSDQGTGADIERTMAAPPFPLAQATVAALLLTGTLVMSQTVDFREKVQSSRSLSQFPLEIAQWRGVRTAMGKEYLDVLKFDDYVMVDYRDQQEKSVNLYTAYYGSQYKGGSIHSPATCLPSGGWVFEESGDVAVPLKGNGDKMRVSRAYMEKGGMRMLTYYWFPQRDKVLTNLYQLKLNTFWNALTSRRTDGALVRVITPVYQTERLADAEARLQRFVKQMVPLLETFLPR